MFKRAKVVMLPTNEKARMCKIIDLKNKSYKILLQPNDDAFINEESKEFKIEPFNLYITSGDEIKEGDWFIDDISTIRKSITSDKDYWSVRTDYKKIIATTDNSLWKHDDTVPYPKTKPALPQPSQDFIEKYVEEYNKGNIITDVLVEYDLDMQAQSKQDEEESKKEGYMYAQPPLCHRLKISKDNTITIKKVKESWDREEVAILIRRAFAGVEGKYTIQEPLQVNKWIEENL